jgi:hypothetical protein
VSFDNLISPQITIRQPWLRLLQTSPLKFGQLEWKRFPPWRQMYTQTPHRLRSSHSPFTPCSAHSVGSTLDQTREGSSSSPLNFQTPSTQNPFKPSTSCVPPHIPLVILSWVRIKSLWANRTLLRLGDAK